jgi:hypothetical protein
MKPETIHRPPLRVLYVATVLDAHDWPGFFESKLRHLLGKPPAAQSWPLPADAAGASSDGAEGSSSPSPAPCLPSLPEPFRVDLRFLGFGYHRDQFGAWEYQYQGLVGAEEGVAVEDPQNTVQLKKVSDDGAWSWEVLEDWLQRSYIGEEDTSVQAASSPVAASVGQAGQGCHLVMGMHGHGDSFWFKHHVGREEGTEVLVEEMVHRLRTGLDLPVDPTCTHHHNHHLHHHFPLIGCASPPPQTLPGSSPSRNLLAQRRRFLSVTLDACIMSEVHTAALFNRITPYLLACQGWMWEEDWDVERSVFNRYTLAVLTGATGASFSAKETAKRAFQEIAEVFSRQSPRGDLAVLDTGNAVALVLAMQQNPYIQGKLVEEYEREKISMPLKSASTSRSASPKPATLQSGECSLAQSPDGTTASDAARGEMSSDGQQRNGVGNHHAAEGKEEEEGDDEDDEEDEELAALALTWDPSPYCFYFIRSEPEDAVVSQYLLCFKVFVEQLLKEAESALMAPMASPVLADGAGLAELEQRVESLQSISRLVRQTILHHSPPTAAPTETNYRMPLDGLSIHLRLSVKEYKHHLRLQCHHA